MPEQKSSLRIDIRNRTREVAGAMDSIRALTGDIKGRLICMVDPSDDSDPLPEVQSSLSAMQMIEHHLMVAKQSASLLRILVAQRSENKPRPDQFAFCCIVHRMSSGEWGARIRWLGPEWPKVEGAVSTDTPADTLAEAIDTTLSAVNSMGLPLGSPMSPFFLSWEGDGEDPDYPAPADWKQLLQAEASRRGWETYRTDSVAPQE